MSGGDGNEGELLAEKGRAFAENALGDEWNVLAALQGGYQQGALQVLRSDGLRAVFKPALMGDGADDLTLRATAVAAARDRGWPATEWISWGIQDGVPWYVQRFAEGRPVETLDVALEASILSAVDHQADIPTLPPFDWSRQTRDIARIGSFWHERCESFGKQADELAAMLAGRCRRVRDPDPEPIDLVHGDFATDNILEHDGRLTIIDTQSIGRGSRAVDLATMSVHCLAWDQGTASAERFFRAAVDVAGPVAVHYAAGRALWIIVFAMDHYAGFVPTMAMRLMALEGFG